ncbi:MAG: histidine kinase [Cyclobacteriaceae bacterium]
MFGVSHKSIWLIAGWSILSVINFIRLLFYKVLVDSDYSWDWVIKYPTISLLVGLLMIFFWIAPGYNLIKRKSALIRISLFLFHGLSFTVIYIYLLFFVSGLWSDLLTLKWYLSSTNEAFIKNAHSVLQNYLYCIAIIFAYDYFDDKSRVLNEKKEIENQLQQSKLSNLQAKLRPHFLFNTLHSIVALIDENRKRAQQVVINLSDLLRFSVDLESSLISVEEEIELLKKYASIEMARYEEQLKIEWQISDIGDTFQVPPLILQPILENSVKHGFRNQRSQLIIKIMVDKSRKQIIVENNGNSLADNFQSGVGLKLVNQQLKVHFGKTVGIELYQEGAWIVNKLQF